MAIKFTNEVQLTPKSMMYGEFQNSEYIAELGEIIVILDYKHNENGINIPTFTIGDGVTEVKNLIIAGDYTGTADVAKVAKKLEHSITIGEHVFDGTSDVSIPIYNGSNEIE